MSYTQVVGGSWQLGPAIVLSGIKTQESSSLLGTLRPGASDVHVSVEGSSFARLALSIEPIRNVPSGSRADGASPISLHTAGGIPPAPGPLN